VNVGARQLRKPDSLAQVLSVVTRIGANPAKLATRAMDRQPGDEIIPGGPYLRTVGRAGKNGKDDN
jgi:hypothetical protein